MKYLSLAALSFALSTTAYADCEAPAKPSLPDGGNATMEQMLAGQKAVKAFQAANLEYMGCVEEKIAAIKLQAADTEDADTMQASLDAATSAFNDAVSAEEEVAGEFNTQIRAYKAATAK